MIPPRTLRLETELTNAAVYVLGTELTVNLHRSAPPKSKSFSVKCSPTVRCRIAPPPPDDDVHLKPHPLTDSSSLLITMDAASETVNDSKLSVIYYGPENESLGKALLHLTAVEISLDVDADRDGVVERNNPNKGSWQWGPNGHGAILLVNCDSESWYRKERDSESEEISKVSDLRDMSKMVLRTNGPATLPTGYKLVMHISQSDAESVRVFRAWPKDGSVGGRFMSLLYSSFVKDHPLVLSSTSLADEVPYLGGSSELLFYVEGLRFADRDFDGCVNISLSLLETSLEDFPGTPIFTDRVMFHVAPWIMTPNTLNPLEVFVCSTKDNYQFLRSITKLSEDSGCKLRICYEYMNRGDRWMQDELELGYIDSPHHYFPVVLDSPRDGSLKDFPYDELLGPDFGHVTRLPLVEEVSSLDSFGNLEVSPPVQVNGKNYPLGRIIIGVAFPTTLGGRNMTKVVQGFLWAQKVQEPIALYSDWLTVGHVDEFMTFVPALDRKGFRLLLASPDAAYKLFHQLQHDGHGQACLFEGLKEEEKIPLDDILSDKELKADNSYVQGCIDWNRDVLKRELGLDEDDIIDLPILFKVVKGKRALPYYPDMVNMIVLGNRLGIPKPFGPRVNGRCALEAKVSSLLEGLGLSLHFINDFSTYHKLLGEIHCGTNVRREPFAFRWWNLEL